MPSIPEASEYSIRNRAGLEASQWAACYYCLEVFPATEVTEFVEEGETGMCPCCGIDSVLPETAGYAFLPAKLMELRTFWFGEMDGDACIPG